QRAREGDLFHAHLRRSVFADRDSAVGSDHFHVGVGVRHRHAKLLEALVDHERRETGDERDLTGIGQSAGNGGHVGLRDAAFEEPLRKFLGEISRAGGLRKVRIQDHHVPIRAAHFDQRTAECFAGCRPQFQFKLRLRLRRHYCSSFSASAASSLVGATPWNLGLFSINETPLPFTVLAISTVGLPLVAAASAKAACSAGISCPFTSITCQPNASHLSTSGSTSIMSFTKPSSWMRLLSTITHTLSFLWEA